MSSLAFWDILHYVQHRRGQIKRRKRAEWYRKQRLATRYLARYGIVGMGEAMSPSGQPRRAMDKLKTISDSEEGDDEGGTQALPFNLLARAPDRGLRILCDDHNTRRNAFTHGHPLHGRGTMTNVDQRRTLANLGCTLSSPPARRSYCRLVSWHFLHHPSRLDRDRGIVHREGENWSCRSVYQLVAPRSITSAVACERQSWTNLKAVGGSNSVSTSRLRVGLASGDMTVFLAKELDKKNTGVHFFARPTACGRINSFLEKGTGRKQEQGQASPGRDWSVKDASTYGDVRLSRSHSWSPAAAGSVMYHASCPT
ncbi:hypothetical protein EDB86DRAFT_2829168 [Lactarius hatsudake]|nr:hypothetical protein EDB86DRAFT_2829168 [Lactarius hatsudake]